MITSTYKEKYKQKQAELRKYLGATTGAKLILKYFGNNSYRNQISGCRLRETDRLLEIFNKLPKMSPTDRTGWQTLTNAEIHFGQPLSDYVTRIDEAGGFKMVRNENNVVTPIVRTKTVSEILGIKPHFISSSEIDINYKNQPQKFLREAGFQYVRVLLWTNKYARVYDKNIFLPYLKKYVIETKTRSKSNNNKKRLDDWLSPEGRIYKKQKELREMFGSSYQHKFILSLFNCRAAGNVICRATEDELDRMIKVLNRLPEEKEIPQGWETLSMAEVHFGEPLTKHVKKLKKGNAFKLIRYFDGVVTPIVNIERASSILKINPHFTSIHELHFVNQFPYAPDCMMKYLIKGNVPKKRFKRWDAHNVITFDADFAIPFLQSLTEMERRPGVFKGRKLNSKNPQDQLGGWKIKCEDDWKYNWREGAKQYRKLHPKQD